MAKWVEPFYSVSMNAFSHSTFIISIHLSNKHWIKIILYFLQLKTRCTFKDDKSPKESIIYCLYCWKKKGLWTTAPSTWLPRLPLTFNELILLLLLGTSLLSTCGPTDQSERSLFRSRLLIGREQMAPEGPPGIPGNPGTVSRGCPLVWWRPRWTTSSSEFKTSKPLTNLTSSPPPIFKTAYILCFWSLVPFLAFIINTL